ncbi:MAG: DUF2207 domain-containing protein, partial [Bifidobacteriaceae bacterium]|nr:DUF2207 domain-containing protein [Bifidobacteriaceae bacterium]
MRLWRSLAISLFQLVVALLAGFLFIIVGTRVVWYNSDDDADMRYSQVHYSITPQANGSLTYTQRITVDLKKRDKVWRQLYQHYTLRSTQATAVTDVSVRDVTNNIQYNQTRFADTDTSQVSVQDWDSTAAHTWYIQNLATNEAYDSNTDALPVETVSETSNSASMNDATYRASTQGGADSDESESVPIEIGWNIPVTQSGECTFEISMTLLNAMSAYDDGVFMLFEPIATNNSIPIDHISGELDLPQTVNTSYSWLHVDNGLGTSTTSAYNKKPFTFSIRNLGSGNSVNVLSVFSGVDISSFARKYSGTMMNSTLNQEKKAYKDWVDKKVVTAQVQTVTLIMLVILTLLFTILAIIRAGRTYNKNKYDFDGVYNRDLLDMCPARAASIFAKIGYQMSESSYELSDKDYKKALRSQNDLQARQINALLLSLISKKIISLYPGRKKLYKHFDFENADSLEVLQ